MNEVAGSVEDMLRRLLREDVRLVTSLAPGLGRVKADRNQLEQVILNLVVNARDAMPGGGTLTIATGERLLDEAGAREVGAVAPGSYVELAVRDTGVGMDDVTRARIFEPFFTTKELGKGTGLGLATVDGIVRQSGGHVVVDTAPGRGTTFSVLLPRAADAAAPSPPEARPLSGARGDETVLLVEDDASVRAGVRALLRQTGYTVLEARDGRDALRLAREHPGRIHVLVTDSVMPGMGGAELASQIEAARPGIGVVFISGYVGHDAPTPVPGRPGAFLPKPFTAAALTAKIREVLDRPR